MCYVDCKGQQTSPSQFHCRPWQTGQQQQFRQLHQRHGRDGGAKVAGLSKWFRHWTSRAAAYGTRPTHLSIWFVSTRHAGGTCNNSYPSVNAASLCRPLLGGPSWSLVTALFVDSSTHVINVCQGSQSILCPGPTTSRYVGKCIAKHTGYQC